MNKQPKFNKGDKVRLNLSAGATPKMTSEVFTIYASSVQDFFGTTIVAYAVQSDSGKIFEGVAESRIVAAERITEKAKTLLLSEAKIETIVEENMQTSDYWLDAYNDYMALYEFFKDEEYREKAIEARREWSQRFGKLKGSDEPTKKGA